MSAEPLIDEELAAFLQSGIALHVASIGPGNVPHITRAAGCRVSADRLAVTVYLVESHGREVVEQLRANGKIAVVFTRPRSHRTVQLKGVDARVSTPRPADLAEVDRQVEAFGEELGSIGFPGRFGRTLAGTSASGFAAITFTPSAAFVQTPGPSAGTALRGG
jgi:hypothetical protein